MKQIYLRYYIILFFIGTLLSSCKEEAYPIPEVPVNIAINLDLPSYIQLNNPGGYAYVNGGSRGIIVYRNFDEFVALDRHSTYNSQDECAIVDVNPENQFELLDTCSGSVFSILNGTVISGPAKFALKRYNASWNGAYTVNIYN
ncbi:MAG: hypothetical protein MI810_06705 [Flavobacteriales bacterium]|nr:hypothetical protein [Flavobacteriales bacterium]